MFHFPDYIQPQSLHFLLETLNLNLLDARHRAEHLRTFQALLRGYCHCSVFTEEEEAKDPVQAV